MNVHPITNGYCTAYLVVSNGTAMLVDASLASITPKVLAKLDELNAQLKHIVLTHFHYDHVGAADPLRKASGEPVAIHHLDADALRRGGKLEVTPASPRGRILKPFVTRGNKSPLNPDLEFDDDEDLSRYGGFGRSFWTPGHTPGSQSVLLPDGTLLAGDALTETILPPHRAEGPHFVEDPVTNRSSITALAATNPSIVRVAHRGWIDPRSLARLAAHHPTTGRAERASEPDEHPSVESVQPGSR